MTTLRLTAIRCLCRDRGLERVKDGVVLKKVCRCSEMVSRWSPKPEAGVRFSSPVPNTK
jgi:hypothetical protein